VCRAADNYLSLPSVSGNNYGGGAEGEGGENALVKTFHGDFTLFKSCSKTK
jgi:hypothetical protein